MSDEHKSPGTVAHGSFTIERTYDASPAQVYAAWSKLETKARWFTGPEGWTLVERTQDFRVGGREILHGKFANGPTTKFTATYHDIVPEQRIVYDYDMAVNGVHISVSLATIELRSVGTRTTMIVTEQGVHFDGPEGVESREKGTLALIRRLGASLEAS